MVDRGISRLGSDGGIQLLQRDYLDTNFLTIGLTVSSIPFVAIAERQTLQQPLHHGWFLLIGVGLVVGLAMLRTGGAGIGTINYAQLSAFQFVYIFLPGAVAITAMVLPGISGSSVLLIAGVYLPTIQAVHSLLQLQLAVFPGLCALGFGVLAGVAFSIQAIRAALQKHRGPMVWLILGLMLGSLYAIANGPASLSNPQPPLSLATFQLPSCWRRNC